jgi:hypothetical protein
LYTNDKYKKAVSVEGIEVIKQKVSCGYACIELLARWQGQNITEASLLEQNNNKITTAVGKGFLKELNKQLPELHAVRYTNLLNTELIDKVYDQLAAGKPVPFELSALNPDNETPEWTLHYAIITGLDLSSDEVTISNPYGNQDTYIIDDFLKATRFDSYEDMPFYFKFGFAAGLFHKNTIYVLE